MDDKQAFVEETRIGVWFLGSTTWHLHVLNWALGELEGMLRPRADRYPVILDLGSGHGKSLLELAKRFGPERLVTVEADPEAQGRAAESLAACPVPVDWHQANAAAMPVPDASVDMVFCHQTLHHIVAQEAALAECFRVLKPGGVLLMSESTRAYIHSWLIRLFFRHPMEVQRTAEEYVAMVRAAGFTVDDSQVSSPYMWWSRKDVGAFEWFGFPLPKNPDKTLVNLVAFKPA